MRCCGIWHWYYHTPRTGVLSKRILAREHLWENIVTAVSNDRCERGKARQTDLVAWIGFWISFFSIANLLLHHSGCKKISGPGHIQVIYRNNTSGRQQSLLGPQTPPGFLWDRLELRHDAKWIGMGRRQCLEEWFCVLMLSLPLPINILFVWHSKNLNACQNLWSPTSNWPLENILKIMFKKAKSFRIWNMLWKNIQAGGKSSRFAWHVSTMLDDINRESCVGLS